MHIYALRVQPVLHGICVFAYALLCFGVLLLMRVCMCNVYACVDCRHKPLSVQCGIGQVEHDDEGRVVTVVSVCGWVGDGEPGVPRLSCTCWHAAEHMAVKYQL